VRRQERKGDVAAERGGVQESQLIARYPKLGGGKGVFAVLSATLKHTVKPIGLNKLSIGFKTWWSVGVRGEVSLRRVSVQSRVL